MAKGEIGRVGVAIDSLQDMEILFAGIPLNSFKRVSILGNSIGPIALSLLIALGEKQGLTPADFVGDLQNDPIKEYIARGTYIFPMDRAVHFACDAVEYCARNAPHWYPMTPVREPHQCGRRRVHQGNGLCHGRRHGLHRRPAQARPSHRRDRPPSWTCFSMSGRTFS